MTETTPTPNQAAADLEYVRGSIERSKSGTPATIYALWGVICLIGFPLVDFAREYVGLYWLIASPLGLVVSLWLGRRSSLERGERDAAAGRKHMLHWSSLLVAIALTLPMVFSGDIAWSALAKLFLIFIALVYFLAGIHLDRRLLYVGLLIVVGYGLLLLSPPYGWTWAGAMISLALFVCAALAWGRKR